MIVFFISFILSAFGQQIVPLIPNTGDDFTPWVGAYHPNGSVPSGTTYWEVFLDDSKFQGWLFDDSNDTGLNLKVIQTCDWNMTFHVREIKNSHSWEENYLILNNTHKGTVTYCDIHRKTYRLMVENNGPQCDNVELKVYIGLGQGICILEEVGKVILRIVIICLLVCLGVCVIGCIAGIGCGVTACYCCCCKKQPQQNYQTMNNYQSQPQYNQAYNQQNYPVQNNQGYAAQPPYSQPNYPVNHAPPPQGYVQQGYVQQPYSTAPNANQPNAMPYNPNRRSEHV